MQIGWLQFRILFPALIGITMIMEMKFLSRLWKDAASSKDSALSKFKLPLPMVFVMNMFNVWLFIYFYLKGSNFHSQTHNIYERFMVVAVDREHKLFSQYFKLFEVLKK